MRPSLPALALTGLAATTAAEAAELSLSVEIPQLQVTEYHRPYVAVWVERPDRSAAVNLAVWYETRSARGTTWLKDMREWWRRTGRELTMPADGLSSATRAPGRHVITVDPTQGDLARLPPGQYNLVVEAAREVGGRELVRVPFQWPPAAQTGSAQGTSELGAVTLDIKP
ncbi:DUF2271 domain-containing protein [Plastoroseomonas hellenica]|uniref:DUF2271 domain-containing protein n=1 Tax=Plastoroseomonas hellenica TaxID=2687306 RepID=UPI001BAB1E04|nr:DUF2271 domain-containing protein [Plastoroseomonas hellenica]MBR0642988.1 DUF2271 domain-containing protein [Plastoroseomonas hellenica]